MVSHNNISFNMNRFKKVEDREQLQAASCKLQVARRDKSSCKLQAAGGKERQKKQQAASYKLQEETKTAAGDD